MTPVTTAQLKAIHALLHKKGLLEQKHTIIESYTEGRSSSSKDMTTEEARQLLIDFSQSAETKNHDDKGPMVRKLFAMAHEIGYINKQTVADESGNLMTKNDYGRLYEWVLKYGYLKKELRRYTYKELPKLLSQFEFGVYKDYLKKINK